MKQMILLLMLKGVKRLNKVDISDWQGFVISRLFEIKSPAGRSIKTYNSGDIPYVSSGKINNGIISYLEPKDDEELEKGNCIMVSPLDGSSFYQEDDFLGRGGAGSAISMLYNENLSKYSGLFICTIIKNSAEKFDYNDALTSANLDNLKIKLPVLHNDDGTIYIDEEKKYSDDGYVPDWEFMSKYMEEIDGKAQQRIDLLRTIGC